MPLGLRNAPGTLQRTMDVIIKSVRWQYAHVYCHDTAIFSRTPQEHIGHLLKVLALLRDAEVIPMLKRCNFLTETIYYLSHVARPRRFVVRSHTSDAIC